LPLVTVVNIRTAGPVKFKKNCENIAYVKGGTVCDGSRVYTQLHSTQKF